MTAESHESNAPATSGLSTYLSPAGAWAFALGTSIGWGSLVVTSQAYLSQAGPYGSVIGIVIGMFVMVIIALCYHFLMVNNTSDGGIYGITRDIFGYDHGALVGWFLLLIYAAMLWANATSLQLFTRFFTPGLFQFGFHYVIFGYDVYLGEALLSIVALVTAGALCTLSKKGLSKGMIAMCGLIAVGITVCFFAAMAQRDTTSFAFDPKFVPGSSPIAQILTIACISSWAFIGFEGISNSSAEFAFDRKKTVRVFIVALVSATALYAFLMLLSVSAYPAQYATWMDYIKDLSNQSGIAAIPAFYAASYYLGDAGNAILTAVLLCLVFTSLFGNITALSRLIYTTAYDGLIPSKLAHVNRHGVPSKATWIVVAISAVIPFLGRTAIGWIVDVTTLGATLIYGFVSTCAIRDGREHGNRIESTLGLVGLVLMAVFGANLLLPAIFESDAMATESYLIFTVWAVLGFIVFRIFLQHDTERRFGKTIFAWIALLTLILCMSAAWMSKIAAGASDLAFTELTSVDAAALTEQAVRNALNDITSIIGKGAVAIAALCMLSFSIMLSCFSVVQRREEESHQRATNARTIANTDPLTGVKSKHAYITKEAELNRQLEAGTMRELGVVVCDVNGLKQVNDTQGHKAGDAYIRSASTLICELFKHSPVYRIGGDEFVVVLEGSDYQNRKQLMIDLNKQVEANRDAGKVVVAAGMSILNPEMDKEVHAAFERADALMYQRKRQLKRPGEEIR